MATLSSISTPLSCPICRSSVASTVIRKWARLESDECIDWGVIGFCVGDIPARLLHMGVFTWTFGPRHVPLEENYPHSEVWAYENGMHVNAKNRLDPHLHLQWRKYCCEGSRRSFAPTNRWRSAKRHRQTLSQQLAALVVRTCSSYQRSGLDSAKCLRCLPSRSRPSDR